MNSVNVEKTAYSSASSTTGFKEDIRKIEKTQRKVKKAAKRVKRNQKSLHNGKRCEGSSTYLSFKRVAWHRLKIPQ